MIALFTVARKEGMIESIHIEHHQPAHDNKHQPEADLE
jgi:hypothetical protein